jgi:hypothetical protein
MKMSEVETSSKKAKAEVQMVKMSDGREVGFAGKRKVIKTTILDESKISSDQGVVQFEPGAVSVRFDLRDGTVKTYAAPISVMAQFIGHGMEQKYGDELASSAADPMSEEDMAIALDDLDSRIQQGKWRVEREGGGVSGAGVVVRALMELTGKTAEQIKAFLQAKIDSTEGLTRAALYKSFRAEGTKSGELIKKLEGEKVKKEAAVNADDVLGELNA